MAAESSYPTIDVATFWKVIGSRAVGATVVTASGDNGPAGFLGLSATHLSASPPVMMVGIGMKTSALQTILSARHFAINYLTTDDKAIADTFGGKGSLKGADRFEEGRWTTLTTGAPVLIGAVGAIDCELEETIERHDTIIAFGRMVDFRLNGDAKPLVMFGGKIL